MTDPATTTSTALSLLTGGVGGAAALIAKEVLAPIILERRTLKRKQKEVYRAYVAPLYAACENLLWRMDEIFIGNRPEFLMTRTMPLAYNRYKRVSTLYRIASVIGWLRAMEVELNSLPKGSSLSDTPISGPISDWKSALADGQHVEEHRLTRICEVWNLTIGVLSKAEIKTLAASFEVKLYELAGNDFKVDSEYTEKIEYDHAQQICVELYNHIKTKISIDVETINFSKDDLRKSLSCLSYREALIYREWQSALGDSFLLADTHSDRRYKMIGFAEFELIIVQDLEWMNVLRGAIDDIDLIDRNPNDFRVLQLQKMAAAIGNLIVGISNSSHSDLVSSGALQAAKRLVGINSARAIPHVPTN